MDVDLLRPGTVPISKDTVMWFEFLLDPNILEHHLAKAKPDPSPTELIYKFLSISSDINASKELLIKESESEREDKNVSSRRSQGLQILALKVAAFLCWDLETIEQKLPFPTQCVLLQTLLSLVLEEVVPPADLSSEPDHVVFVVALYHRWALRALLNNLLQNKLRNMSSLELLDERMSRLEQDTEQSIHILTDIVKLPLAPQMMVPSSETFVPLVENDNNKTPDWAVGDMIPSAQFLTMVLLDLATYLFYKEEYSSALLHFEQCRQEFRKWNSGDSPGQNKYFKVELSTIEGFITACQTPVASHRLSLTDRFLISINNHYDGILAILSEDNRQREVPCALRDCLELDIAAAISSGGFTATRDLIFQIQSLNTVYKRAVNLPCIYDYSDKLSTARRGTDIFVWALKATLSDSKQEEMKCLTSFVLELLEIVDPNVQAELKSHDIIKQLIKGQPLAESEPQLPEFQQFVSPDFNNIQLKINELEHQLVTSYDPEHIKEVIMKLIEANALKPVWQIENKWELGIPLHGILLGQSSGSSQLQNYLYVLLGKAKYLDGLKRYELARRLLVEAEAEANHHGGMVKLAQLISWEILLVESHHFHEEWPNKTTGCTTLVSRCLNILQMGDAMVLPRGEVVEQAAVTLLNLGEWDALVNYAPDKRLILCDLAATCAQACQDIVKFKGNKKISRGAWDLMVPVFGPAAALTKRGLALSHGPEAPLLQAVLRFVAMLRDWTVLSAVISLLARLHNVIRDEVSLELIFDYTPLWPGVVSNTSSFNVQLVSEHLLYLVNSALEYYPKNTSLLKLLGDYYFINQQYSAAMKQYLLAVIIVTENFSRPFTKATLEDCVYKRMIKSLAQMNCNTQAGVLCQFLEEVDYNTAFKSLAEGVCHDCMDTYYDCIWDVNILEYLIYLQNKRGNKDRAKKAIDMIGLLELNANNNEEIKREAANKRKIRFMQALVRQYVL